jgi:hypothetical protein
MISAELERTAHAYLVAVLLAAYPDASEGSPLTDGTGALVASLPFGVLGAFTNPVTGDLEDEVGVPLAAGVNFYLYRGSGMEPVNFPCAVLTATEGEEPADEFAGNQNVTLEVSLRYAAAPEAAAPAADIAGLIRDASDAVQAAFVVENLPAALNSMRVDSDALTVIGLTGPRASRVTGEGRARIHTFTIPLHCAGCDLGT